VQRFEEENIVNLLLAGEKRLPLTPSSSALRLNLAGKPSPASNIPSVLPQNQPGI
jgi:hypothetical protein